MSPRFLRDDVPLSQADLRQLLTPLGVAQLPDRQIPVAAGDVEIPAAVMRVVYQQHPKMLERLERAVVLAQFDIRFGRPEDWGDGQPLGPLKKGFPKPPRDGEDYTVVDADGYGVVVGGYPLASTFCPCPDFWNRSRNPVGTCKHQIAADLWRVAQLLPQLLPPASSTFDWYPRAGDELAELYIDPFLMLVLLCCAHVDGAGGVRLSWTGTQLGMRTSYASRTLLTSDGTGHGTAVLHSADVVELLALFGASSAVTELSVLRFEHDNLSVIDDTFTWPHRLRHAA